MFLYIIIIFSFLWFLVEKSYKIKNWILSGRAMWWWRQSICSNNREIIERQQNDRTHFHFNESSYHYIPSLFIPNLHAFLNYSTTISRTFFIVSVYSASFFLSLSFCFILPLKEYFRLTFYCQFEPLESKCKCTVNFDEQTLILNE